MHILLACWCVLPAICFAQLQEFDVYPDQDLTLHLSKHQLNRLTLVNDKIVSVHNRGKKLKFKQDKHTGDLYWIAPTSLQSSATPFFITTEHGVTFSIVPYYDRVAAQTVRLVRLKNTYPGYDHSPLSRHLLLAIQQFLQNQHLPHQHFKFRCHRPGRLYTNFVVKSCIGHRLENLVVLDYTIENIGESARKVPVSILARVKDIAVFTHLHKVPAGQRTHLFFLRRAHG